MNKRVLGTVGAIIPCIILILLTLYIVEKTIKNEATKAKTEIIQKVKAANFNDSIAANHVAKTIHKFTSFKNKVKRDLKDLNSADTIKN